MTSHSISISPNRIDIFLRDSRDFGHLYPEGFRLDLWLDLGLASFSMEPHCGLAPIYHGDAEDWGDWSSAGWKGVGMDGAVTLVGDDREVIDQAEFRMDGRSAGLLWMVLGRQAEMGWSRDEVTERTWWARESRRVRSGALPFTLPLISASWVEDTHLFNAVTTQEATLSNVSIGHPQNLPSWD